MKHIKSKYYTALMLFASMAISCENDLAISQGSIGTEFFSPGDDVSRIYLAPGGSTNSSGAYMDLRSGSLYTSGQMTDYYHDVDLAYIYGSVSGNNLLTMDAQNVSFSDVGEEMEHAFPYKNKGELYRYTGATDADVQWFRSLSTAVDVQRGYDSLLNVLVNRGGAEAQPAKRLANLQRGNIVLFHGINRNIRSIIYIEDVAVAANGTMRILVKSDMGEQVYFQKPDLPIKSLMNRADTLVLQVGMPNADENYIDLLRRKVYKVEDLENDDVSQITLMHSYNGSRSLFFTMTSSFMGSEYRSDLWNWVNTLPARRNIHLYRLDNRDTYLPGRTFEDVRNNNVALKAYGESFESLNSWTTRFSGTSVEPGLVFRIRDVDNDMWGVMKVLSVDNSTGICRVALKYYYNEGL